MDVQKLNVYRALLAEAAFDDLVHCGAREIQPQRGLPKA